MLCAVFLSRIQRFRALPRVASDIEHGAIGALKLDLEEAFAVAFVLPHAALGAKGLELLDGLVGVIDKDAEVVHSREFHTLADLVGLKLEDGEVQRAVAQEIAIRQRARWASFADLLEAATANE